jgi:acetylornithine deacetylase/succinyl-diaminopimelate desuccinylase-like protein
VGNVSNFVRSAGVPAVYCGVSLDTAHSDNERTSLSELMEVTRIYVHAVLGYLGVV